MLLEQYYLGCLAHAFHLVADQVGANAAVIDPQLLQREAVADVANLVGGLAAWNSAKMPTVASSAYSG